MAVKPRAAVPELGDSNNNELANPEPAEKRLQRIYLGPTINSPYLKNGTVFLDEVPTYSDDIKKLIVPLDKVVEFEKRLNDPERPESIYYQRIKKGVK